MIETMNGKNHRQHFELQSKQDLNIALKTSTTTVVLLD